MNFLSKKFIKSNQRILALTIAAVLILSGFLIINKINQSQELVDIQFPLKYAESLVVTAFNHSLSIQPINASVSAKAIRDRKNPNVVKYIDVFQNTDIVLTKHTTKLKEDIILKQPGHPQRFSYLINCNEYLIGKDADNNIHFFPKDREGSDLDKIFTIPAPFMIDAQGAQSSVKDVETFIKDNVLTLIPNPEWLKNHPYPIILDPTIEIHILNVHSHPQAGDDWAVFFTTKGTADLFIIPEDQATIDDLDFVSLKCGAKTRAPQILENDVIFYPNWFCDEKAQLIRLVNIEASHTLKFQFGDQIRYAYNSSGAIRLKGNIRLKGGVRLAGVIQYNDIGAPGEQGFGVGACSSSDLPSGFSALTGSADKTSAHYGNYQFQDDSIMVFIPKFYYRIGHVDNPTYGAYGVNSIDVKSIYDYTTRTAAETAGYALHRVFIDGGAVKDGFFVDKYMCSQNSYGGEEIASSIKNGLPISTAAAHNPIKNLTACSSNYYWQTINAAHGRGSIFQVASRFQYSAMAMLSMAHGQASSDTTHCAWYDATYNYPKGCNNNNFRDYDEVTNGAGSGDDLVYTHDGYASGNCGKTGSGVPFAKSTHNGQNSGVADLNGLMWEVTLGVTRTGTSGTDTTNQNNTADFYILKESVAMKDLQSGWHSGAAGAAYETWGDAAHLALYYDQTTIAHIIPNTGAWEYFGSGADQVLSEATSGTSWLFTGIGIPKDNNGDDGTGTNLFGKDGIYKYHRANLCLLSCAGWDAGSHVGVWAVLWHSSRTTSNSYVAFRAACYPD